MKITCKNCNHTFEGNYCNNCGQTAHTHEINFSEIIHELQHSLFHVDKGILYTSKQLLFNPGKTISEYIDGKRVAHFKPFSYVLILSTIYAFLSKFSKKNTFLDSAIEGFKNGAIGDSSEKMNRVIGLLDWFGGHYAYFTLLFIPIVSLSSYLFFKKSKHNYSQHLVLNSYLAGLISLVLLMILPFTYFVKNNQLNEIISSINTLLALLITLWTYFSFFKNISAGNRIAFGVLSLLFTIILSFLVSVLVLVLVSLM